MLARLRNSIRLHLRHAFFTALLLLLSPVALSRIELVDPAPYAKHITSLGDINLTEIHSVFQDSRGYMWFGTSEGAIRYDGFTAVHFTHDPDDPHSISHNHVYNFVEGPEGNLWLTTYGGGLNKYNPHNKRFEQIDLTIEGESQPARDQFYDLTLDDAGILWIGTRKQPYRYDIVNRRALPMPEVFDALPDDDASHNILFDSHGNTWIITLDSGAFRFDGKVLHHYSEHSAEPHKLAENTVRVIYEDSKGLIWLGTHRGLNKYDPTSDAIEYYQPSSHPDLEVFSDDVFSIIEDIDGSFWLGGVNNGPYKFNPTTSQFSAVTGTADLLGQFKPMRVNQIYQDKDRSLWFGGNQGLIYLPRKSRAFRYLTDSKAELKMTQISQFEDNKLMFAGGWLLFELQLDSFQSKQLLFNGPKTPMIYRFGRDSQNNLYVGTLGGGLMAYSPQEGQLKSLDAAIQPAHISPISAIFEAKVVDDNNIWIAPLGEPPKFGGGLLHFDPQSRQMQWQVTEPPFVDIFAVDDNHLLLPSSGYGLHSYFIDSKQLKKWRDSAPDLPNNVHTVFKDSQGRIWLGSDGQGLVHMDPQNEQFKYYSKADGLLSNIILSINEDTQGNLWLGTAIGLTRFNPDTSEILNIEKQDGLLFSTFYKRTTQALKDGRLAFGTHNGLVLFDPADFAENAPLQRALINDFRIFNKPVAISTQEQPTVLSKAIEYTKAITLSHDDFLFSFDFATTEYQRPDNIQFAYRMRGLDENWIYTDANNRRATYTTLPADQYVFEVKVSNNQGQWSQQVSSIQVTVLPPWYLTTQAIAMYVFMLLLSIYLYIRVHTAKLKKQARLLEDKVAQRTEQLQSSRDELAQKSETVSRLLAQKQRLFASVSHEFRTPLTLILSPVEQLLKRYDDKELVNELSLVKRNGRRLLRMVDQLLEFAKLEQQSESKFEAISMAQAVELISASFKSLVASKNITLEVAPCPDVTLWQLPDSFNKILINILSNAVKYTPSGGSIAVTFTETDNAIVIAVKDNGIGIAKQDKDAIFERFNRATHDHGETISGAGIGLSLVKELVEANDGEITLDSELGAGSTFTVTLPLATDRQAPLDTTHHSALEMPEMLQLELDSAAQIEHVQTEEQPAQLDESRKSILLIDDNADMRNLLHSELSGQYHCLSAADGQQGLEIARQQLPDMIISDIMMPVMDGYELAQNLRGDLLTCHIPLILLTAKGSVESRIKGLKLLVDDYLPKPFNVEELQLRIHNILSIRDIIAKKHNQMLDQHKGGQGLNHFGFNEVEQNFVERINLQLSDHYKDIDFNAKKLSENLSLSERQLHRKVKALFDVSIPEMVRNFRLKKARELLVEGHRASQVYFSVGFASHSYFSSCFKAKFGQTPSDFQKARD